MAIRTTVARTAAVALLATGGIAAGAGMAAADTGRSATPTESEWNVTPAGESEWNIAPAGESEWHIAPAGESEWNIAPAGESEWNIAPQG